MKFGRRGFLGRVLGAATACVVIVKVPASFGKTPEQVKMLKDASKIRTLKAPRYRVLVHGTDITKYCRRINIESRNTIPVDFIKGHTFPTFFNEFERETWLEIDLELSAREFETLSPLNLQSALFERSIVEVQMYHDAEELYMIFKGRVSALDWSQFVDHMSVSGHMEVSGDLSVNTKTFAEGLTI
jgi:hypothetical protein